MGVILVTSLGPGEGKTAFCAGLALLLQQQGHHPLVFKARVSPDVANDPDVQFFQRLTGSATVALPLASSSGQQPVPQSFAQATEIVHQASAGARPIIIEGPPVDVQGTVQALTEALDARVVLVTQPPLSGGMAAVEQAALSFPVRLLGVVLNGIRRYQGHTVETAVAASLRAREVPVLALVPEDRRLLAVTVGEIAQKLNGRFLTLEERGSELVDHLVIGGNVLDWGVHYFSQLDSKAVIVRSDRPDIQMAALHTPTRCLVLTGGREPLQYVRHEAMEEEVPLILVPSNTLETAKAAEDLFAAPTVHHLEKAQRYAQLLAERLDMAALSSVLA
ncbi:MAG: phosphotransacetylase family protein [Chloroflexi bacterium]|nr:phosphotransacetylase family protein [Chloroflexota bacterium]